MLSLSFLREEYQEWLENRHYMVLSSCNNLTYEVKHFAVLLSKRGNSAYVKKTLERFNKLYHRIKKITFFDTKNHHPQYTPALWITLTYDPKLCTITEAWQNIGKEFNRFKSAIQRKYGKASFLRVFEASKNGYPHIHCITVFQDMLFQAFRQYSRKTHRYTWRIQEKRTFEKYWHSLIDVQAVNSLNAPMKYLKKYLTKSINAQKATQNALNTLALTWKFHKRSFAIGNDLITALRNSNIPLRKHEKQVDLFGNTVEHISYHFVGVVPEFILGEKLTEFEELDEEQIQAVEDYLEEHKKT